MSMSVSGLGSNLDINGIVSQLMEAERVPLSALTKKEANFQAKISAFGSIRGALSTLQNAVAGLKLPSTMNALDFYSTYKGSLADDKIASATAGEGAVPGSYTLEVSQLAKQHRIASNPGGTVGTGTLTIELGNAAGDTTVRTTTVEITSGTLTSVRDAINSANAGVTAAVVNGNDGPQLVLTGESGGDKQFIRLSGVSGLNYSPSTPGNFTQQQGAQSALLSINGIAIESQSNKVTDALQGVTLDLKKETEPGSPTTLTIERDTSSLNRALDKMVTAFNDFGKLSKELGGFNAETRKLGTLGGDSTLRGADAMLRNAMGTTASTLGGSTMRALSDIGIRLQRDGSLKLDTAELEKAIAKDFAGVARVAAAVGGALDSAISSLNGANGSITNKTEGIKSSVKSIELRRTEVERRLTDIEARYRKQFTALDSLVSGMLQTSNYLQQQLANLPSISK